MSVQVKRRREAASFLSTFVGAAGELLVDTTNNRIQVHDGATSGGFPTAKLSDVTAITALTGDLAGSTLPATTIAAGAVTGAKIASGTITGSNMVAGTVTSTQIANGTVTGTDIAAATVAGSNMVNNTVTNTQLAANAAANNLGLVGAHGGSVSFGVVEGLISGLTGASVASTVTFPNPCLIIGCSCRVTTTITGATGFNVGLTGAVGTGHNFGNIDWFGGPIGLTAGTTNAGIVGPTGNFGAVTVTLTAAGANFTAGAVRIQLNYILLNPPTS